VADGAKTALARLLDPLLNGFERRRWTWNKSRDGIIHVVELVGSKHGTGTMTVEWGVTVPGWQDLMFGTSEAIEIASGCAVYGRLGEFGGGDRSWDLAAVTEAVPEDMRLLFSDHLLPFFDSMSSVEDLAALVERGYRSPRRRTDPAIDDEGRPWGWSWPWTEKQRQLTLAVLRYFTNGPRDAMEAADAVKDWERAAEVAARIRTRL
jgi:hypothetical protein